MTPPRWRAFGRLLRDLPRLVLLLAPLPVLLALLAYAATVLVVALDADSLRRSLQVAARDLLAILAGALAAAGAWYLLAAALHRRLLEAAIGAFPVTVPEQAPRLWLLAAELSVRADMHMPRLAVIEARSRNLLAWQLGPGRGGIAVTTGLLDALPDRELSAALATGMARIADGSARLALVGGVLAAPLALATDAPWRIAQELGREVTPPARPAAPPAPRGRKAAACPPALPPRDGSAVPSLVVLAPVLAVAALGRAFAWPLRRAVPPRRLLAADAAAAALARDAPALIEALRLAAARPGPAGTADALRPLWLLDPAGGAGRLPTHPALPRRLAALDAAGPPPAAPRRAGRGVAVSRAGGPGD